MQYRFSIKYRFFFSFLYFKFKSILNIWNHLAESHVLSMGITQYTLTMDGEEFSGRKRLLQSWMFSLATDGGTVIRLRDRKYQPRNGGPRSHFTASWPRVFLSVARSDFDIIREPSKRWRRIASSGNAFHLQIVTS